jgi:hypothetical protein
MRVWYSKIRSIYNDWQSNEADEEEEVENQVVVAALVRR